MTLQRSALVASLMMLLVTSCTSLQSGEGKVADATKPISGQEFGKLELHNVTTTPQMNALTFRGIFSNPYDEPIENIRIVLHITLDGTPEGPLITRAQDLLETRLEPGATVPFAITAKVNPKTLIGVGMFLEGFAVRRGDETLPIPPRWQE